MKAITVLKRLKRAVMDLTEDEYERLLDVTGRGSGDFLFLSAQKIEDWISEIEQAS